MSTKFTRIFECHNNLRQLVESNWDELKIKNSRQAVASFIFGKAHKTHQALLILCDKGFGQDAAILSRSLFELEVTLLYILANRSDYMARRYLYYDWVVRLRRYNYAQSRKDMAKLLKSKQIEDDWKEVEKQAKKAQDQFKYTEKGWSDRTLRGMAKRVKLLGMYDTIYRLLCDIAHSSTRTINDYISDDTEELTFETGQSEIWIQESLVASFDFYFHIVSAWGIEFSLNIGDELKAVAKECEDAVKSLN